MFGGRKEEEGYCVKCRKKVKMKDAKEVKKMVKGNERRFLAGKCPNCGTAVWRVLPKK